MKIVDVEAIPVRLPEVDISIADGIQDDLILRIHTDGGIVGVGETDSCSPVVKAIIEAPSSWMHCQGIKQLIVGEDPFDIGKIWEKMYQGTLWIGRGGPVLHAMSAVDMALWDIVGKALGKPVFKLLGGAYRDKIRVYASTLFTEDPGEMRQNALSYVRQGFTAVKFGWGPMGDDPKKDIELVKTARKAVGEDVSLLVDAGCCWDAITAIRRAKEFEKFGIYWLEEPLPADDLFGYAKLCESVDLRIATGEQETTASAFRDLIAKGKVSVIQPDVSRAGGITACKKIASLAHDSNVLCVPHAWKTDILLSATLHLVATLPRIPFVEFCVSKSPLRKELVLEPLQVDNGFVRIPQKPGLGIELNEAAIKRYSY